MPADLVIHVAHKKEKKDWSFWLDLISCNATETGRITKTPTSVDSWAPSNVFQNLSTLYYTVLKKIRVHKQKNVFPVTCFLKLG